MLTFISLFIILNLLLRNRFNGWTSAVRTRFRFIRNFFSTFYTFNQSHINHLCLFYHILKLKEIGNIINGINNGKNISDLAQSFTKLSESQKVCAIMSSKLSKAQKSNLMVQAGVSRNAANAALGYTEVAAAETAAGTAAGGAAAGVTAFGAALKGAAASAKALAVSLLSNPLTYIVAILGVAAVSAYKFANAFDDAKDAASDSAGVYSSTKSEIEYLNSELETTSSRIEELQAQGTLSLSDEAELAKLQRQSAELQNQINLKQRLAEIQSEQSVKDTMDALTVRSSQSKAASENTIYMTGQYTGTNSDKYTDIVTATELDVRRLRELKEENNKLYEDWKVAPESGKDEIQKWIDKNEKEIDKYEETISEHMADISELGENLENASSLDSSAQKMLDRIHQLSTAYSSIDLSSVEQNFSALESYFSSSSNSFLKDFITDAVASGEKATDVIGQLGLSLSQIGLPEDAGNDLNKYFQDLAKSASGAANAVDEIDSSLSGIEKASESQNAGDNFDKYLSYIDNARRYYAQGKTGIDDFKTVAASLNNNSQDAEENLKQFKGNLDKIKKYLTVDTDSKLTQSSSTSNVDGNIKSSITLDDGQLTVTKQNMLDLADAFEVARKKAASTGTEFKSTAELAEALDVPIDFLEYAMGKMQDYNISTAFDDLPKASENLAEAKDGLSQLQEIYDSMSDSDSKEFLGKQIEGFQKQIDEANGDLSKLDTDIVCQLKLEYDLAYLQSVIDDAEARIAAGGGSEDYVTAIAAQSKQIGLLNETTHLDKIEAPIEYRATEGSIAALKEQLKGITNEEQKIRVQAEIKSLQQAQLDVMGAFQNAHPEITAETDVDTAKETFDKWLDEENGKELVINAATQMDESVKKLIEGGDIEVDAFVDYILGEQADPELKEAAVDYFTGEQQDPDPKIAEMFYKLAQQDPANPWYPLLYYVYGGQDPAKDDKNHSVHYRYGSQAPAKNSYDGDVFYGYGGQDDPEDRNAKVYYTAVFKNAGIKPVQANIPNGHKFNGTAHAQGTAYASGNWGLKRDEYALINELGAEAIIRGSKYYIFNNGFPTFAKLKKGDIVFNSKQTEELLKHGYVTNSHAKVFGSSYAQGTVTKSGTALATGTSETVDWLEILLDRAERIVKQFTNKLENTFKGFNSRMSALTSAISSTKTEISKNQSAYNAYMQKANSVKLSDSLKKQVREGAYYIYDYDEKTQELIESYRNYYEKALDAKDAIDELTKSLSELYKQAFDIVSTRYDNEFAALNNRSDMISNSIDLAEAGGYFANIESYSDLIKIEESKIAKGQQEYADLTKKLNEAVASGAVEKYSDEWWDMYNQILEVANGIQEAQIAVAEFEEAVRELKWEQFDFLQERISQITEEADFLIGLLENSDLFDDAGQFTSEGLATVSLRAVNYNTYMAQAKQYAEELKNIEAELANDPSNKNLIERREELLGLQRDSIEAAYDERDAIADLIQDGIDAEMDAVEKLIDAYTDALDSAKDLYEYRKKVADYSDDIAKLRKQLIAYQGDTSEEARAQVQKITVDLAEAEENLREAEYDQYISDQKKMLDEFKSDYQAALNERLDNLDSLIEQLIADANANSADVTAAINEAASNAGYTLTDNMTEILSDTNGQIAGVTSVLSDIAFQVQNIVNAVGKISTDENGIPILNEDGTPVYEVKVAPKVYKRQFSDTSRVKTSNKSTLAEFEPVSQSGLQNYSVSLQAAQIDFPYANSVAVENTGNSSTTNQISVSAPVTVSIDHVLDYNDFVTQLQNDPQFEKMVQMMTVDQLTGKSSLEKYKLKWRGH